MSLIEFLWQALQALREKEAEALQDKQKLSIIEQEKADQTHRLEMELLETEIRMARQAKEEVSAAANLLKLQQFVSTFALIQMIN